MDIYDKYKIAERLQTAIDQIKWPDNAQEPDVVATLVKVLPEILEQNLNTIIHGKQIVTGSAFIHQKPLAHFISKSGYSDPELGDLLIVCREKRYSGYVFNAMLLQAKRDNNINRVNIPNDHQYILYSEWPEFEYKRAGRLDGIKRSVLPKTITQGAQYLLMDKSDSSEMYTATVNIPLVASKPFSWTLASILSFEGGRTFQVPDRRDDWSQMIIDLLNLSYESTFTRNKSGFKKEPRLKGKDVFDCFIHAAKGTDKTREFIQYINNKTDETVNSLGVICVDFGQSFKGEMANHNERNRR